MTLQERGLLYSMRLECWANKQLPKQPEKLAKLLGFSANEILASLPAVMHFFSTKDGMIVCPELDAYRAHLERRRERMSSGGKAGAAKTNNQRKNGASQEIEGGGVSATPSPTPSGSGRGLSTAKPSVAKQSQNQPAGKGPMPNAQFVSDYEQYEKASRGY